MNIGKNLLLITFLVFCACLRVFGLSPSLVVGDTIDCVVDFELSQSDNGDFVVSMISDTTWDFPNNLVSTAQVTIKAPKGQLEIGEITNLLENVIFFVIGTDTTPIEAPDFDYISIALGSQGTAGISFQKGKKIDLFSFTNLKTCNSGIITLMENHKDPFFPPNIKNANVGQQLTVAGFNLADVPIGIRGEGIACSTNNDGESDLNIQIVKQDISCFGRNDGIIIAKENGGNPPYSYLWNTRDTFSTLDNLSAGDYTLTITDADGISSVSQVTIIEPDSLMVTIDKTDANGPMMANGTATPIVTGGTAPFQFGWNNGSTDSLQTNLLPGTYALAIEDASGCEQLQT
ncbi:MAG: SprB repeat-containing protein, partial [Saprospiraceae bacterium]